MQTDCRSSERGTWPGRRGMAGFRGCRQRSVEREESLCKQSLRLHSVDKKASSHLRKPNVSQVSERTLLPEGPSVIPHLTRRSRHVRHAFERGIRPISWEQSAEWSRRNRSIRQESHKEDKSPAAEFAAVMLRSKVRRDPRLGQATN